MDVTFQTQEGRFNYRVCAIIIHDGRLLAMKDERSPYYYLPGGRVKLHETAEDALLRELREELETEAELVRPLWVNQSFFTEDVTGGRYHELCVYFLTNVNDPTFLARGGRFTLYERQHTHVFEWLPFTRVRTEYLYPLFIKERIFKLPESLELLTTVE